MSESLEYEKIFGNYAHYIDQISSNKSGSVYILRFPNKQGAIVRIDNKEPLDISNITGTITAIVYSNNYLWSETDKISNFTNRHIMILALDCLFSRSKKKELLNERRWNKNS